MDLGGRSDWEKGARVSWVDEDERICIGGEGRGRKKERKKERRRGGGWKMPARVSPQVGLVGEARSDGYRWIQEDPMVFCA